MAFFFEEEIIGPFKNKNLKKTEPFMLNDLKKKHCFLL